MIRNEPEQFHRPATGHVNIFVFNRERKIKQICWAFYNLLPARVKSMFHHRKFYVVNARSSKDATAKVESILQKKRESLSKTSGSTRTGTMAIAIHRFEQAPINSAIKIFMTANQPISSGKPQSIAMRIPKLDKDPATPPQIFTFRQPIAHQQQE